MNKLDKNQAVTMEKLDPELDGASPDIVSDNIERLRELFPDVFTEGKIDFDALRRTLGDHAEDQKERYSFTWHGKSRARRIAQTPSTGTLLPCPEESVNWDTTQNIFIEGDNLEVLKLLQKSYHRKVKMIYIDPPYNTGKEFIYPDKYQDNLDTYLRYTGQIDAEGFKLSANAETSGRYHTNWLNMMYPRLRLARNLLRDDGIIFISIDDHEATNLVKVCDEIFGEESRLGMLTIVSNLKGRSDDKFFATAHNYLLAYSRGTFVTRGIPLPLDYLKEYTETDGDGRRFRRQGLRKRGTGARREDRPKMYYPFYGNPHDGSIALEKDATHQVEILPSLSDGTDGRWRWGKETAQNRLSELLCRPVGAEKRYDVFQIDYADDGAGGQRRIIPKTVWQGPGFANETGTLEVKKLLGPGHFDNPKPVGLVRHCLEQATSDGDLILDFFAGSGTTGEAVMQMNAADSGNRRFVLVQLPEPTTQAKFPTIAHVTKARLTVSAKAITDRTPDLLSPGSSAVGRFDGGFKTFKLSSSNIKLWDTHFDALDESLLNSGENIKPERGEADVLYELLLKYGLDLAIPIESRDVAGKQVSIIGAGALVVCLAADVNLETVEGIAALKAELGPEVMRVVFRDDGFADDVVKTNTVQILKQAGIDDVKSL